MLNTLLQLLSNRVWEKILLLALLSACLMGCGNISDGEYTASVVLEGGSGRSYIESPCTVTVKDGVALAHIRWSSPNYDYMIVDGTTYYPVNTEGNSEFDIPVRLEKEMEIKADTTAMSTPHLIDYKLLVTLSQDSDIELANRESNSTSVSTGKEVALFPPVIDGLTYVESDENSYAQCFRIHRYENGFVCISIDDDRNYLLVPKGEEFPDNLSSDIYVLKRPLNKIYLAASGAMCHFDDLGAVDDILLSGIEADNWYIDSAKDAMKEGTLLYGGKYNAPDYEQMIMLDIDAAIESTMILHVPKVQEKIEQLGIPVFIDRSSYEKEPLGRCEWIKVYGVITGNEEAALASFKEQEEQVRSVGVADSDQKEVVIFSLNSNHQIVTRMGGDYFAKMIEMAGGKYIAPGVPDQDGSSQATISIEAFYDYAADADILIYNATISGVPDSLSELSESDVTFADFKAFKEGNVWYTDKSLYQYANKTGSIINDLGKVIAYGEEETEFFHKLK